MPDLLTHSLFVYPAKKIIKDKFIFILIGSILPDLFGRILGVFISGSSFVGWYQTTIHTPLSLLFLTYSLSFFFPQKDRKTVFGFLIIGITSHLFLDFLQKNTGLGYLWFFPFSFSSFNIPLFWPDDTIYLIPFFLCLNFALLQLKKTLNKLKWH